MKVPLFEFIQIISQAPSSSAQVLIWVNKLDYLKNPSVDLKNCFCLENESLAMLEAKLERVYSFRIQSGKITVWLIWTYLRKDYSWKISQITVNKSPQKETKEIKVGSQYQTDKKNVDTNPIITPGYHSKSILMTELAGRTTSRHSDKACFNPDALFCWTSAIIDISWIKEKFQLSTTFKSCSCSCLVSGS